MDSSSNIISAITESPLNSALFLLILLAAASLVLLVVRYGYRIPGNHLLLTGLAVGLPVMNPANLGAKTGSKVGGLLSVNLSSADLLVIPAVLLILFGLVHREKPLRLPLIGALASYFILAIVSLYIGSMKLNQEFLQGSHFVNMTKVLAMFVYFYVIINLIESMDDLKVFLKAWTYTAPVIALIGIAGSLLFQLFHISNFAAGGFRASSTLGNPNLFAGYMALSFFITWLYLLIGGKRLHCFTFMLINLAGLTLSSSKGGLLAFGTGAAVFFLLTPEHRRKIVAVLATALLVVVVTYFVSEDTRPTFDRLLFSTSGTDAFSIGELDEKSSLGRRLELWTESLEVWKDNILLGVGKGNSNLNATEVRDERGSPKDPHGDGADVGGMVTHSIYISILSENGLIGFTIFIGIFLYFIITSLRGIFAGEPGSLAVAVRVVLLAAFCGILAQGSVTNNEDSRGLWVTLGLIWLVSNRLMPVHSRMSGRHMTAESPQRLHHKEAAPA